MRTAGGLWILESEQIVQHCNIFEYHLNMITTNDGILEEAISDRNILGWTPVSMLSSILWEKNIKITQKENLLIHCEKHNNVQLWSGPLKKIYMNAKGHRNSCFVHDLFLNYSGTQYFCCATGVHFWSVSLLLPCSLKIIQYRTNGNVSLKHVCMRLLLFLHNFFLLDVDVWLLLTPWMFKSTYLLIPNTLASFLKHLIHFYLARERPSIVSIEENFLTFYEAKTLCSVSLISLFQYIARFCDKCLQQFLSTNILKLTGLLFSQYLLQRV